MVYKNLLYRLIFSILFFGIYYFASNHKYLLFAIVNIIYLLVLYEILVFFKKFMSIILFYILLSYICFSIYFIFFFNNYLFNILVFSIILFDSFSFLSGIYFGKIFIFKKLSPKKTLEGYLGGFFLTNLSFLCFFYFTDLDINLITLLILINLIVIFSIFGDLIESYFKRKNNIKDSSKFLPGHGGFFDRFDSFLASIILLFFIALINL